MLKATKKEIADITSPEKTPAGDPGNGKETAFSKAVNAEKERVREEISDHEKKIVELKERLKILEMFS